MIVGRTVLNKPKQADQKTFHVEFKSVDTELRRIKGFASTKFKDRHNDIVDPKAFEKAMGVYMQNPQVLLQHDMSHPIGKTVDFQIVPDGLYVTIEVGKGFQDADETWQKINQGILKAFSIGFYPLDSSYDPTADVVIINALELVEISIVSIPANRESLFSIAKAFRDGTDLIDRPNKSTIATLEIKKHLTYLKSVYALLPVENKIEVDGLKKEFDNIFDLDERSKLLKMTEDLSKQVFISASLRGGLSDSGELN